MLLSSAAIALAVLGAAPAQAASPAPDVTRSCATATAGHAACFALRRTAVSQPYGVASRGVTRRATPAGLSPASLQSAYKLPSATAGSGQTVAIVDAYNDPSAAADLAVYRAQFGLPACTVANGCFRQVNQNGASAPLPANNAGWAGEISLDLDMVSAACPNCKIILVEANSASTTSLYTAEDQAVALGAKFVSNSWGGGEYSGETSDDAHFNHPGVVITVSTGDNGAGAAYPATSRYVTAVGGTSLSSSSNARGWSESAWSGAGSGCSAYEPKPAWQSASTSCTRRAEADVSAVADPNTGVAVYQTYGGGGWAVYGGTSASAPIVAAASALAGTPAAGSYPASLAYSRSAALFDVTSGKNGSCGPPLCSAGAGWDGPTGLGTPNGTAALGGSAPGNTVSVAALGAQTVAAGTAFSLQVAGTDSASGQVLSYSASGLPAGLAISAGGLISGTPTVGGSFPVTVTATDATGASGSASFALTVTGGACASAQLLGNAGLESGSPTPWATTPGVISANNSRESARSGGYFAWLDGYGKAHTDVLTQTVTIPAACTRTSLSFWLHVDTAETTTAASDVLLVQAGSSILATYSNLNRAAGYTQVTLPLGAFAGQSVNLAFVASEDYARQTSFVLDDLAVTTS